jgi:hypothetical protein
MEKAAGDLFNFATDRDDVKWLLEQFPSDAEVNSGKLEYELQILKIITVGWILSYYLEPVPEKNELLGAYWGAVHSLAQSISTSAEMLTDSRIDYFGVIRERLDIYLKAMSEKPDASEPASVIGPEFARICGNGGDIHTIACGTRMFVTTTIRVKEYLDSINVSRH